MKTQGASEKLKRIWRACRIMAPIFLAAYLKESRPLALSRSRDAWLLIGAAGLSFLLLAIVVLSLLLLSKRKRAQSSVLPPPRRRIIRKDEERAATGIDNTAYTTDTEARVGYFYQNFWHIVI